MKNLLSLFRKYYVGGSISLLLLPVLCIGYFKKHPESFQKSKGIDILWYFDGPFYPSIEPALISPHHSTTLNGSTADSVQLLLFDSLARRLAQGDTSKGIHIHFKDGAKYHSFVSVMDIINSAKISVYAPAILNEDIWIIIPAAKPEMETIDTLPPPCRYECLLCDDLIIETPEPDNAFAGVYKNVKTWLLTQDAPTVKWETERALVYAGMFWPSGVLFLGMVVLGITNRRGNR